MSVTKSQTEVTKQISHLSTHEKRKNIMAHFLMTYKVVTSAFITVIKIFWKWQSHDRCIGNRPQFESVTLQSNLNLRYHNIRTTSFHSETHRTRYVKT